MSKSDTEEKRVKKCLTVSKLYPQYKQISKEEVKRMSNTQQQATRIDIFGERLGTIKGQTAAGHYVEARIVDDSDAATLGDSVEHLDVYAIDGDSLAYSYTAGRVDVDDIAGDTVADIVEQLDEYRKDL